jgi:hypothetical protein
MPCPNSRRVGKEDNPITKLNSRPLPKDLEGIMDVIFKNGGSKEAVDPSKELPPEVSAGLRADVNVSGTMWIKGSEIITLEVLDPKPAYFFKAKEEQAGGSKVTPAQNPLELSQLH